MDSQSEDEVLVDAVLEVVEEVLEVAELNCFEFAGGGVDQHVEHDEGGDEDDDVGEDLEVEGQGVFEEEPDHQFVLGLAQVGHQLHPREQAHDPAVVVVVAQQRQKRQQQLHQVVGSDLFYAVCHWNLILLWDSEIFVGGIDFVVLLGFVGGVVDLEGISFLEVVGVEVVDEFFYSFLFDDLEAEVVVDFFVLAEQEAEFQGEDHQIEHQHHPLQKGSRQLDVHRVVPFPYAQLRLIELLPVFTLDGLEFAVQQVDVQRELQQKG